MSPATTNPTAALAAARHALTVAAESIDLAAEALAAASRAVPGGRDGLSELGRRASALRGEFDAAVARPFDRSVLDVVLAQQGGGR